MKRCMVPQRPSQKVVETKALSPEGNNRVVKMERTSTGGTRRQQQLKIAKTGAMSECERAEKKRKKGLLFPDKAATLREKDAARKRLPTNGGLLQSLRHDDAEEAMLAAAKVAAAGRETETLVANQAAHRRHLEAIAVRASTIGSAREVANRRVEEAIDAQEESLNAYYLACLDAAPDKADAPWVEPWLVRHPLVGEATTRPQPPRKGDWTTCCCEETIRADRFPLGQEPQRWFVHELHDACTSIDLGAGSSVCPFCLNSFTPSAWNRAKGRGDVWSIWTPANVQLCPKGLGRAFFLWRE